MFKKETLGKITDVLGNAVCIISNPFSPIEWIKAVRNVIKVVEILSSYDDEVKADLFKFQTGESIDNLQVPLVEVKLGEAKKALVVYWINERVNLPLIGEDMESKVIGNAIDFLINIINIVFGKNWIRFLNIDEIRAENGN